MPTPTPNPEPAAYVIESIDAAFVGVVNGMVSTEFSITVRNIGGDGGLAGAPVMSKVDENEVMLVHELARLAGGDSASYVVTRDLALGQRAVSFTVGDSVQSIDIYVRSADLVLEPLQHTITGDGSIELPVRVANQGDLTAEAIIVSADWTTSMTDSETPDSRHSTTVAVVDAVSPGESRIVDVPIDIPAGAYAFTLRAETETIEVRQDNNSVETVVEVDYVLLVPSVQSTATLGYGPDGDGVVEVTLSVGNMGVAPSGPISIGLACVDEEIEGCSQEIAVDSIAPGTSASVSAALSLPQGETTVSIFAGANEDGYRWGNENVQQATIFVPHKPAVSLALSVAANVGEYWSDGTADVELTMSLLNEGYRKVEEPQPVTVVCLRGNEPVNGCGAETSFRMADGYQSAASTTMVRAPMGSALQVNLGSEGREAFRFEVPESILGVDRDVWECYSDRPGKGAGREGCGGWFRKTVAKWDHDVPVRVWAHGRTDYIQILETVMEEVAPLVNLEFERVYSKREADIEIQLGADKEEAPEIDWRGCIDYGGCADVRISDSGNVLYGFIVVWDAGEPDEGVKGVILHELLHVVVPIVHRHTFDTLMGEGARLSLFDEALIRLHSHRLIEPGMTMDEVEELIVFNDELADSLPETEYQEVWAVLNNVVTVLEDAGSARFNLTGSGSPCRHKLVPGVYEISDFKGRNTGVVHYQDRFNRFLHWEGDSMWKESSGVWEKVEYKEFADSIGWWPYWIDPLVAIRAAFAASSDDEVSVLRLNDGRVVIEASVVREGYSRYIVIVVDEKTFEISRYSMTTKPWLLSPGHEECALTVRGDDIEYRINVEIPEYLVAGRSD